MVGFLCEPASSSHQSQQHRGTAGEVIIMGMSRSGSSLTTSIVASVLGNGRPELWRGGGAEYPADGANQRGYYERSDVVALNYEAIRRAGERWYIFPHGFAESPRAVSWKNASPYFRGRAASIVADMDKHARGAAWVLKDVRFARTLPLWSPHFSGPLACIVPFRHPSEVAASSRMSMTDRMILWQNYLLAALATAHSLRCPTMLVAYDRWVLGNVTAATTKAAGGAWPGARYQQLVDLVEFLHCAGISGLPEGPPPFEALQRLIQPSMYHHRLQAIHTKLPASVECLWEELRSGRALRWTWDERAGTFAEPPCVGGRPPSSVAPARDVAKHHHDGGAGGSGAWEKTH